MKRLKPIIDENRGSLIREVIRSAIVAATAFGLQLSGEQVGGIYLFTGAVLQLAVQWDARS